MTDYWRECIAEAFEDAKITATDEQIANVAGWAESASDNYGAAIGYDCIPNPETERAERLKRELAVERGKVMCPECKGAGRIVEYIMGRRSDMHCSGALSRTSVRGWKRNRKAGRNEHSKIHES